MFCKSKYSYFFWIVTAALVATTTETKKQKSSNDGVSMYTNELYAGGGTGSGRNRSATARNSDDFYDDYNADYDIPIYGGGFRKPPSTASNGHQMKETREVALKQGRLKGLVRAMHPMSGLRNVDQFLGIPYAEAPVGHLRFMPPGAPTPWTGTKMATKFAPVCPQRLPDINSPDNTMSKGRYDQIKRLLPYLKHESEDCLYLNLYVPSWGE